MSEPRRLVCTHFAALGDSVVATATIKALHQSHPGRFLTDFQGHHGTISPPGNNVFENNPYITRLDPHTSQVVNMDYGRAINSCGRPFHFLSGFVQDLERKLGVKIELKDFHGDIYLSPAEREPWPGLEGKMYAVIDAGYKNDFTAKMWSHDRYQKVVNETKDEITWVQIGSTNDNHIPLNNVVNLLDKTNNRQLIQVIYGSSLVLTPVSAPMHLAAAVPTKADGPREMPVSIDELHVRAYQQRQADLLIGQAPPPLPGGSRFVRPCVCIAGSREPNHWDSGYPGHVVLGATGNLKCGQPLGTGCWANKTIQIDSDMNVCRNPMPDEVGFMVPECLHRISVNDVVRAVRSFL